MAMIEIADNWNGKGVFQKEISEKQEISFKYLDAIISSLKASGLIVNAEGRGSGYKLSRKPESITVYDVYKAFENDLCIVDCLSGGHDCPKDQGLTHQDVAILYASIASSVYSPVTFASISFFCLSPSSLKLFATPIFSLYCSRFFTPVIHVVTG